MYHIAAKCIIDNDSCYERAGICIYVRVQRYYIYFILDI